MVKQKAISARIDKKLLQNLELEASLGYMTKNRILNCALAMYLDFLETRRRCDIIPGGSEQATEREHFIARYFCDRHKL